MNPAVSASVVPAPAASTTSVKPPSAIKVFIASDHRGFNLKSRLLEAFPNFIDLGPKELNPNGDYNDAAVAVSKAILENPGSFGVLICGSAIGISIQANRFRGIRAALAYSKETVRLSREHNNANILCISADEIALLEKTSDPAKKATVFSELGSALKIFFNTPFSAEERHSRRVKKLDLDYNLAYNPALDSSETPAPSPTPSLTENI